MIFSDLQVTTQDDFEAANIMKEMIDSGCTICLTLAGALTPIGMGNTIKTLIENGFVDWIVTTGANVYHDLHFAYDLPVRQGHFQVDDDVLFSKQIMNLRCIYKRSRHFAGSGHYCSKRSKEIRKNFTKSYSTADMSHKLGKAALKIHQIRKNHFLLQRSKMIYQSSFLR